MNLWLKGFIIIFLFNCFCFASNLPSGYNPPDPKLDPDGYFEWKMSFLPVPMESDAHARPLEPMDWTVANGYVRADVDETTGEFDEGGDPGGGGSYVKLTYSFPESPGTEWVMYYVDGNSGKTSEVLPNTSSNYILGNTVYSIWNNWNGVYIRQEITPVSLGGVPGENEQIKFKAVMKPADGSCHNCGCIVYYDTMLDWNDAAPISTAFGYTGISEIFYAPDIPPVWRAYENGFPPVAGDLVALGILIGFEAVMPDVFWYGSWPTSVGFGWGDAEWAGATGGPFGDSATMVKWYPRNVCPGDSIVYVTYYGIGELVGGTGLTISHSPPTFEPGCADVSPNPFVIDAIITNIGTSNADNVQVTLSLPAGLTLSGGANPQNLGTIAGYGGSDLASWTVTIPPSSYGTTQCYDITVNWTGGGPVTEHYCINIPNLVDFGANASADDYDICSGDCTQLHAWPDSLGGGGTVCTGWSHDFEANNGGMTHSGSADNWAWGTPTSGPGGAHSGSRCWATNLSGDYNNYEDAQLVTPGIDLTGCSSATLSFWHWYSTETSYDGCQVYIGTGPAGPWTFINMPGYDGAIPSGPLSGQNCYRGNSGGWVYESVDITAYVGAIRYIRFYFASDLSVTYPGWYIDDISVTGTGSGGIGPVDYYYSWTPTSGLSDPASSDPTACPTSTTTYTVEITALDDCIAYADVTITVHPDPVVTIAGVDICEGESGTLTANVSPPGSYTYSWSPGGATTSSITVSPASTTTYTCTVTSAFGCTGVGSGTITVNPMPVVTVDDTFVCPGESVTLTASVTPAGSWGYAWSPGGATTPSITVSPATTTTYTCYVMGPTGCESSDDATVTVMPDPVVTVADVDICEGESAVLTADVSPAGAYTYLWSPGGETTSSISVSPTSTTTYTCEVLSEYGCPGSGSGTVNVHPIPDIDIADAYICLGDEITLTAFLTPDIPGSSYEWSPGGGTGSAYTVTPTDTTTYTCTVTTPEGCVNSGSATVFVEYPPEAPILVSPPNGSVDLPPGTITLDWEPAEGDPPITYNVIINGVVVATGLTDTYWDGDFGCDESYTWAIVAVGDCGADTSEYWTFSTAECDPPIIEIIEPLDSSWSACDDQAIIVYIFDDSGVETTSIRFTVNGTEHYVGDGWLTYIDDTLVYSPSPLWTDGEHIHCCLDSVCDVFGNVPDSLPICWDWDVDLTPPVFSGEVPAPGSTVPEASPTVEFDLEDFLSGLADGSVTITINDSITVTLSDGAVSWVPPHVTVSLGALGLIFETGDTVEICVHAEDSPDYCDPNELDTCWSFMVDPSGPVGTIIEPLPGTYTACDPQPIIIALYDENGINHSSVHMTVEGVDVWGSDPTVSWSGDTLIYTSPTPFEDGDTINVVLDEAEDLIGNPLATPLTWVFYVDYSPPYIGGAYPPLGGIVPDASPTIDFDLWDLMSGVDDSSVVITINDSAILNLWDTAVSYIDPHITVSLATLGWIFESGDTVTICVHAEDSPDYCDPNALDTCWWFVVNPSGPNATIIEPLPNTFSACDDQNIIIVITDPDGVVDSTVHLVIDGVDVWGNDATVSWLGDTLIYTPTVLWVDAETVVVELLGAEDIYCNPLADTLFWTFIIDLSPPEIWDINPPEDAVFAEASPVISFSLGDWLSGLDISSVTISIGGGTYSDGDPGFSSVWSGETLDVTFNCSDAGITFAHNDTVEICVAAADSPDYCPPNLLTYCWEYLIDILGPVYSDPFDQSTGTPINELVSACNDQGFCMELVDSDIPHGVAESTIVLNVAGIDYTTADPQLTYLSDTLCFTPTTPWMHGADVIVALTYAEDSLGNPLAFGGDSWEYEIDLEPPVAYGLSPSPGAAIGSMTPIVTFSLTDGPAGVDLDGVEIGVDILPAGTITWFDLSEPWFTRTDSTYEADIAAIPLIIEGGDTIRICVHSADTPDLCPPNEGDTCWTFHIPTGGPVGTVVEPLPGTWSACVDGEILLTVSDPDTVIAGTIIFSVDGDRFMVSDSELEYLRRGQVR